MLINLSNHRLEHWSDEQLKSAREKYGSIYDSVDLFNFSKT